MDVDGTLDPGAIPNPLCCACEEIGLGGCDDVSSINQNNIAIPGATFLAFDAVIQPRTRRPISASIWDLVCLLAFGLSILRP